MNSKSTLGLVVLAGLAGLLVWKGDDWGPKIGLPSSHQDAASTPATEALKSLNPASLSKIEVVYATGTPLKLERIPTDPGWKQEGNWPIRKPEVEQLVETLGNLRTRFQSIPISETTDLAPYGLATDQKALVVKLTAGDRNITLTFGNPSPGESETSYTRPAFVRVNDFPEVLRVGPDVMPLVSRSADTYRRRQLFTDVARLKISGAAPAPPAFPGMPPTSSEGPVAVTIPGPETASIQVSGQNAGFKGGVTVGTFGNENFLLTRIGKLPEPAVYTKGSEPTIPADRLADTWALDNRADWIQPDVKSDRDRVEPERLRSLLVAVSDLWVDQFVAPADIDNAMDIRLLVSQKLSLPLPFSSIAESVARVAPLSMDAKNGVPIEVRTGLADSNLAVKVKQNKGEPVSVHFGGIAWVKEREETITLPGPMGAPPQTVPKNVPVAYRYARIDGNPQLFIVSAEKFADIFTTVGKLADPQVARFSIGEVQELTIRRTGGPEIKLMRKKGNPKATNSEEKKERWFIDAQPNPLLADSERVNELLTQLSGFSSDDPNNISYKTPEGPPQSVITIVAREKRADDGPEAPARTYTLNIGKPDADKRLLPVQLAGWPRVTSVNDKLGVDESEPWFSAIFFPKTVSALIARSPLSYRGRKLFDTADSTLGSVNVTASAGGFSLTKDQGGEWKLIAPLSSPADPGKASQLTSTLSGLESTEYLADSPGLEALRDFGLDKPAQVVTMSFTGGRTYKLELGNPRPSKPEVFARLDGGGVFGLPATVVDQLSSGVVGLLPLKIWSATADKVTGLEITRSGDASKESFALAKNGNDWKLSGAFQAPVSNLTAQPLLTALGVLQAVKYQALTITNAAEFGLDKPLFRLKISYLEKKPTIAGTPPSDEELAATKTLVVGGTTPDGGNRYAMLDAPNAPVFVIPAAFSFAAQIAPLELIDRSLLVLDPFGIGKVQVNTGKPENSFSVIKDQKGKWAVEGISFEVDAGHISQLLRTLQNLPVARLAAYGDGIKWGDFGLEKPTTSISVMINGDKPETHTIAFGNVDPTGAQFVRVDDKKAVGVLSAPMVELLARGKFDYADGTLLTFNPTTLAGLVRQQGKDELELVPGAAVGWDVVKPAKYKADQAFVEELADSLSRLKAEKVVAYGRKDQVLKQFGLEPPAASITLTVGDKAEQKILRLGNLVDPAKPEGDRYAAVDSPNAETAVGILPAALTSKLLASVVAFRDHTLAKFVDADKAVLERGDRKITFAKVGAAWKVTEPLVTAAESAELESLVADFGKLRVDTWVAAKGGDLGPYGLDKPEAKWSVFDGDKLVLTLLLGKKTPDGRVHVTTDKSDLVGLLDPILTARVLAEYRQRRPWEVDVAQVEAVEIEKGSAKFSLNKAGPLWFDQTKPGDRIDVQAVNELLGALGALRVERYAADKDADPKLYGLEKPEERITVTLPGGMRKVLEIGAVVGGTDGKQRYARVADKAHTEVFVLSAADTARFTRERDEYVMKK